MEFVLHFTTRKRRKRGRRGNAPTRLSRRRFSLRFIEKKNGGETTKKR